MLETVRQYAGEKLRESGEQETIQRQHRDFFLTLAEEAGLPANKPQQPEWFSRLEAEHDNLQIGSGMVSGEAGGERSGVSFRYGAVYLLVLARLICGRGATA